MWHGATIGVGGLRRGVCHDRRPFNSSGGGTFSKRKEVKGACGEVKAGVAMIAVGVARRGAKRKDGTAVASGGGTVGMRADEAAGAFNRSVAW